jgi:hypothetical protein
LDVFQARGEFSLLVDIHFKSFIAGIHIAKPCENPVDAGVADIGECA